MAFDEGALQDDAKIGILAASIIAALAGAAILATVARTGSQKRDDNDAAYRASDEELVAPDTTAPVSAENVFELDAGRFWSA